MVLSPLGVLMEQTMHTAGQEVGTQPQNVDLVK